MDRMNENYKLPFVHFQMLGSLYVELTDPLELKFVQYELFGTYLFGTCSRSLRGKGYGGGGKRNEGKLSVENSKR
jgi:hypothetical protein